ncbi:5-oxoprolinase subunit PxpA [Sinomicrobium weinanense]|uniref:5-oxoprolinase subunit PxpA n=1 Tax=Sinomicrobium weinanense TaxID=2842200 RepID=A0A926JRU6_9FLAO|nr:5-oxoprolinase subunit PxpA [Sinomicrobium weinanense]MBC9796340.1 5-oxoprolinase subunit PxpA [Sinomicrobium weinanense]MBU3122458.1 5-oxoprolinase subunit PxpA [Sinomicrobium weinanense]
MTIDINCDVGEGLDNEHLLMPCISSCSIACGGHAGDEEAMRKVVNLAVEHGVKIGAHPSYPDRENFGRRSVKLERQDLIASIREQVKALEDIVIEKGTAFFHIKAHGALYNDMARDRSTAEIFLSAIEEYRESVFIYAPYNSEIESLAVSEGFRIKYEAFADRNYNDDLSLVPRSAENAVIHDKEKVLEHLLVMIKEGKVLTTTGNKITIKADTFCLHGDNAHAVEILEFLSKEFKRR